MGIYVCQTSLQPLNLYCNLTDCRSERNAAPLGQTGLACLGKPSSGRFPKRRCRCVDGLSKEQSQETLKQLDRRVDDWLDDLGGKVRDQFRQLADEVE